MARFPSNFQNNPGSQHWQMEYAGTDVPSAAVSRFFNNVYAWMATGLALTATVAWLVAQNFGAMRALFTGPSLIILFLVEIALVAVVANAINRISTGVATALFLLYSGLNGLTLSVIFLVYTQASLVSTFAVTAITFGVMSVYGMVTRRDLTRLGSLLFMALIGIIIASVVNIFLHSP